MQQRYYDPQIGRFVSSDPAESEFNRYNYASNNPYTFFDPDGLKAASTDPNDPINDPDRPNGCGTMRDCTRDSEGNWHNGVQNAVAALASTAADLAASNPLPQGVVDAGNGVGSGIVTGASFGFADGDHFFDSGSSDTYDGFKAAGTGVGALATLGGAGKLAAPHVAKFTGPSTNWFRYGPSRSSSSGQRMKFSFKWGASPAKKGKYLRQIPNDTFRQINQWLRSIKIPGTNWRVADPGHLHIQKLP